MHTYIYHSVNAGLYFSNGQHGLWVDGVHNGKSKGFSPMPEILQKRLETNSGLFRQTDELLFTHLHTDHFCAEKVAQLQQLKPNLLAYGPGFAKNNVMEEVITTQVHRLCLPSGAVFAKNTIHDGEAFQKDLHQSYLIQQSEEFFFVAGDADLTAEDAKTFAPFVPNTIKAGFFNLYQLFSEHGQEFVRSLPIERVFLYHLPFPCDDKFNYAMLAKQIVRNPPQGLPTAEILSHMSWIDDRSPNCFRQIDASDLTETKKQIS